MQEEIIKILLDLQKNQTGQLLRGGFGGAAGDLEIDLDDHIVLLNDNIGVTAVLVNPGAVVGVGQGDLGGDDRLVAENFGGGLVEGVGSCMADQLPGQPPGGPFPTGPVVVDAQPTVEGLAVQLYFGVFPEIVVFRGE